VDLTAPGRSIAYSDTKNLLFVRATPSELKTIEHTIRALNQVAPQIHIKVRFIEVPRDSPELPQVELPRTSTNKTRALMIGILTDEQTRNLLHSLIQKPDVETLAEPEIITVSGRQTKMRATTVPIPPMFDAPDISTTNLTAVVR
jgi:type II secretory pathway component GspD/PulD (secretin)